MIEEIISLKREDVTLGGMIFIPERGQPHPTVIIAHGLPSTPLPVEKKGYDDLGRKICALGMISIIFNFSGCQGSSGFFSIKNWVKDLTLVSNYIWNLKEVNRSRVSYLAFSLGTYPTIYYLAQQTKKRENLPKCVFVCASPADLSNARIADLRLGIHYTNQIGGIRIEESYEKEIINEFKEYMPIKWIPYISIPKFIIHGTADELVDVKNAYRLYEKATDPKELILLEKTQHKIRDDERALNQILKVIGDNL